MAAIEELALPVEPLGCWQEAAPSPAPGQPDAAERWQQLIDERLLEWGRDPSGLADDEFTPPSVEIVGVAHRWAKECQSSGFPAPTRIVPDGGGGIAFELQDALSYHAILIHADGKVEAVGIEEGKMRYRKRLA
jgi:hypothetical protein